MLFEISRFDNEGKEFMILCLFNLSPGLHLKNANNNNPFYLN